MTIVMWDWDGTLVDTMPMHADLAAMCIEKHFGMDFQSAREQYLNTTGIPFDHQLRIIFPEAEEEKVLFCAGEYHKEKMTYVYENPKDFPETLKVIKKVENIQIISSSTEENIIKRWTHENGLEITVLGRESGSKRDHILKIKELFPESKIIFVSDSYGDMDLPVEIALGVDVPKNKENLFWKNGAQNVSFEPVSLAWFEEIKKFLV